MTVVPFQWSTCTQPAKTQWPTCVQTRNSNNRILFLLNMCCFDFVGKPRHLNIPQWDTGISNITAMDTLSTNSSTRESLSKA